MHLVLFDCDGTLSDSFGLICETMRRSFAAHDLPEPGDAATRAIIGLSLDIALARLAPELSPATIAVLAETYRATFRRTREDPSFREALFPGIADLLARLAAEDEVLIGMVTGKTRRGVDAVRETHGLTATFATIRCADDCPSKPHPAMVLECCGDLDISPRDAVVVGDAVYDMQMARAAGAAALGVTWGSGASAALTEAGADRVLTSVEELSAALDTWIARDREAR